MDQIIELLLNNIELVTSGVLALLALAFGAKWVKFKNLVVKIVDLINEVNTDLKDGKLSKEELERIIAKIKAIVGKE